MARWRDAAVVVCAAVSIGSSACSDPDADPTDETGSTSDGDDTTVSTTLSTTTMGSTTPGTTADDTSSESESEAGSGTEDDSGSTTTPDGECNNSGECFEADEPICVDAFCVACDQAGGDAACLAKDPTTPLCNARTHACEGCTHHAQCPESACDLATSTCLDADIVHVDGDPGCSDAGAGDEAMPFCSIQTAIDGADPAGARVVIVHPTTAAPYAEALVVAAGTIALLGAEGGNRPALSGTLEDPWLTSAGVDTRVYVENLRFSNNTDAIAMSLGEAEVWLDRVEVVRNFAGAGGGIDVHDGARVQLRSSVVGINGSAGVPNLRATGMGTTVTAVATTFVNIGAGFQLQCDADAAVTIRNSILVDQDTGVTDCDTADVTYSAVDSGFVGDGNVVIGDLDVAWFVDVIAADLHLSPEGAAEFADIGVFVAGDYPLDIDGEPRPTVDGTPDFAGADIP